MKKYRRYGTMLLKKAPAYRKAEKEEFFNDPGIYPKKL